MCVMVEASESLVQPGVTLVSPGSGLGLTFSVDWAVPKKIGTKASQTMQVVYMVKPIGFASLNVSGTPRLFTAYTVHVT